MMVGHHQPVFGDQAARAAAGQAHGRQPDLIQPWLVGGESVFRFYFTGREIVEGPHPLIGAHQGGGAGEQTGGEHPFHQGLSPPGIEKSAYPRSFEGVKVLRPARGSRAGTGELLDCKLLIL